MQSLTSKEMYPLLVAAIEAVPAAFAVSEEEGAKAVALQDKLQAAYYAALVKEGR